MTAPATSDDVDARGLWRLLESVHAVTYFADESRTALRAAGCRGFWMGYFAARAAPLGPVPASVVVATFANFHPGMVARSLPDAWTFTSPEAVLAARREAAAAAIRRASPGVDGAAPRLLALLTRVVAAARGEGRPLFAANRALPVVADDVAQLWQLATCLREHRGDGHVAALAAAGLDGCEVHVLFAASERVPVEVLRDNRGWSEEEWRAAEARLERRGLLAGGSPTDAGREVRATVEAHTDALAAVPFRTLSPVERGELVELLTPIATAVVAAGIIPFPNPMGLPAPAPGGVR